MTDTELGKIFKFSKCKTGYCIVKLLDLTLEHLIIPETYRGFPITGILSFGEQYCINNIQTVSIKAPITKIPDSLFESWKKLSHVELPETVNIIGHSAFKNCIKLKHINLPTAIVGICHKAFYHCGLLDIVLPPKLKVVSESCFENCRDLAEVFLPAYVHNIQNKAFLNCKNLRSIVLPSEIQYVASTAFCIGSSRKGYKPNPILMIKCQEDSKFYRRWKTAQCQNNNLPKVTRSKPQTHIANKIPMIYIYNGFLPYAQTELYDCRLIVTDILIEKQITLFVTGRKNRNYFYMSCVQLQGYLQQDIKPKVCYKLFDSQMKNINVDTSFNKYSILALYGYSVKKNDLTLEERRRILLFLLHNKIVTASYIIQHLQGLIHLRQQRTDKDFTDAISAWKKDIQYINKIQASHYESK